MFLKCDVSTKRLERELIALRSVEVPTPEVLWERMAPPRIIALSQVPGEPLRPTDADERWSRTGATIRTVHDQTAPAGLPGSVQPGDIAAWIDTEIRYATDQDRLPWTVIDRADASARALLDANAPAAFCHGDLQPDHVFFVETELIGIIDWADARIGDPSYDLAVLTSTAKDKLAAEGHEATRPPRPAPANARPISSIQSVLLRTRR